MIMVIGSIKPMVSLTVHRRLFERAALVALMTMVSTLVEAGWSAEVENNVYYTDDVALFSVTRRLSLQDDPTQPVVDRPQQGGDFVYEPRAELEWSGNNSLGEILLSLDAGGYVFVDQSAFTHGLYEFQLSQTLSTDTKISLHYNFVPDLFLGENAFRQANGEESEQDEKLISQYWSIQLDHPLTSNLTVRLLGRYGLRNYNAPFQHRDTQFWTLVPHLEWVINPDIELLLGYHYERGLAEHQKAINFDDADYIKQFNNVFNVSADAVTINHVVKAIASFERTLISGNSPFDRYYFGMDQSAISMSAARGSRVFRRKGNCANCHEISLNNALFTDNRFYNIGVGFKRLTSVLEALIAGKNPDDLALTDAQRSELGRFNVTKAPTDLGKFKTPTLRNIALTAPYMHDGSIKTLEEVIEHYDKGGDKNRYIDNKIFPLHLTQQEKADLAAFMQTLTSHLVPK